MIFSSLSRPFAATILAVALLAVPSTPQVASASLSGVTACRFGKAQVFDTQWSLDTQAAILSVSQLTRPYSTFEPGGQLSDAQLLDDDYFAFYEADAGAVGFRHFAADGTLKHTLHQFGTLIAYGDDFLFYDGGNSNGTLITTGAGYDYGLSVALDVTEGSYGGLENALLLAYDSCSSTLLAPGETLPLSERRGSAPTEGTTRDADVALSYIVGPDGAVPNVPAGSAQLQFGGSVSSVPVSYSADGSLVLRTDDFVITIRGDGRGTTGTGPIVTPGGEIVCEVCAALAAGSVIEAWMFSTPRLVAAVRVKDDGVCPLLRIPLSSPLDGGGTLADGPHTLQLLLPTANGMAAVNVGLTVRSAASRVAPTRVTAGGGANGLLRFDASLLVLAAAGVSTLSLRRRTRSSTD
jgi:hypothetical protein